MDLSFARLIRRRPPGHQTRGRRRGGYRSQWRHLPKRKKRRTRHAPSRFACAQPRSHSLALLKSRTTRPDSTLTGLRPGFRAAAGPQITGRHVWPSAGCWAVRRANRGLRGLSGSAKTKNAGRSETGNLRSIVAIYTRTTSGLRYTAPVLRELVPSHGRGHRFNPCTTHQIRVTRKMKSPLTKVSGLFSLVREIRGVQCCSCAENVLNFSTRLSRITTVAQRTTNTKQRTASRKMPHAFSARHAH